MEKTFSEKADLLFNFVMLYHDFAAIKKDYGTGKYVSMIEAHTLLRVAEDPGVTISQLAERANRTKSAVSQIIKKLEQAGYVYREFDSNDRRIARLYPTDLGQELNVAHLKYDAVEVAETFEELRGFCSQDDIDAFFRVMAAYLTLFSEE